jgi:hypothetical protein
MDRGLLRSAGMASDPQPDERAPAMSEPGDVAGSAHGVAASRPRWLAWLAQHRRRLAPLVLVGGVLLVAGPLSEATPRATNIRVELAEPQQVREVTLSVLDAGEAVVGVRLAYERGAPERIEEALELPAGRYELRVDVTRAAGADEERTVRALEVPSEGTVVIDLSRGDA